MNVVSGATPLAKVKLAVSDGDIFIRADKHLRCVGKRRDDGT
jgi:hypothetical protein